MALKRSSGVAGGAYQSVMMMPPNGSAEASGMKDSVSSAPRQRNAFTATGLPVLALFFLPPPNRSLNRLPPESWPVPSPWAKPGPPM